MYCNHHVHMLYHQINTLEAKNKDEWDTKEGTSKSIKCMVCTAVCKRHLSGQSDIQQWPIALAIVNLHLASVIWPGGQLVRHSLSQSVSRKFC